MRGGSQKGENPFRGKKIQFAEKTMDNLLPAGLRGRVIFGKGNSMEELIKRLERVIQTGVPDKDGMHPISAEVVLEVVKELSEHGTNLASLSTDCISRQQAIDAIEHITTSMSICLNSDECHGMKRMQRQAVIELANMPAIQPKRGRWEMGIDERFVECSECGLMTTRNELRGIAVFGKNEPNFCPNCGADMRGEQDE